jgi:hypothetical protein
MVRRYSGDSDAGMDVAIQEGIEDWAGISDSWAVRF